MSAMKTGAAQFAQENVGSHSPTVESLRHAVCKMKPQFVHHILHSGVNVNEPVDPEGHTVLDCFAVEHQAMMKQLIEMKGNPEEKTAIIYSNMENAREILHMLVEHGAKMSCPETQRKRVAYIR